MTRRVVAILTVLLITAVVHVAALLAIPRIVMHIVAARTERLVGVNAPLHVPAITASSRNIPLPSPDLRYSACTLDVSHGPVTVSVTPGDTYLSLSIFDMRSDNIYVANDQNAGGKPVRLLVVPPDAPAIPIQNGVAQLRLAGTRAVLLLRALSATPALAQSAEAARKSLTCS